MDNANANAAELLFPDCNAEHVFVEVNAKIKTSEMRALWVRLQEEIRRQGVGASTTYLGGEFTRLKEDLKRELSTATTK